MDRQPPQLSGRLVRWVGLLWWVWSVWFAIYIYIFICFCAYALFFRYFLTLLNIYIYGNFSFVLVHEDSPSPSRPKAVPEPKSKNEIGHEIVKNCSISGIFLINPKFQIRIFMFWYRTMPPNAKNIEKTGRSFSDIFPDGGPILYIFLLFKQAETAIYLYISGGLEINI